MNPNSTKPMRSSTGHSPEAPGVLDSAITRALNQAPEFHIPADFAARTARRALNQPRARASLWLGWGPRLALGSGGVLLLALFALAPHAAPTLTSARFDAELVIFAELSALLLFAPRLLSRE